MGPNLARLLENYWKRHWIVPKVSQFLGEVFGTGIIVTQGDPISPMIFNILVDLVVRAALEKVCSPQEAQLGMGLTGGEINLFFYVDDGRIAVQDHEWVSG